MIPTNRIYHYIGMLTIKRSRVLSKESQPKDDKVNWLFLEVGERQFSFVYKMEEPLEAIYEVPFKISLSFTMIEEARNLIELNNVYNILRGQEIIGTVRIDAALM